VEANDYRSPDLAISDWYSDRVVSVFKPASPDAGTLLLDGDALSVRIGTVGYRPLPCGGRPTWRLGIAGTNESVSPPVRPGTQPLLLLLAAVILIEHFDRPPLEIETAALS
jgi:hypothetical protein